MKQITWRNWRETKTSFGFFTVFTQIFLFVALTVLAAPVTVGEPVISPKPFKRQPLLNRDPCSAPRLYYCTELRDVTIGKYALKIPHNLIGQWPPENNFIELLPRWPGLKGAIKDEKFAANFDSFDIVHILIHTERPRRPTEEGIRDLIQRLNLLPPKRLEIGLLEYKSSVADTENISFTYYSPLKNTGLLPQNQPLFIQCSVGPFKRGDDSTMECQVGYTIQSNLYVTLRFFKRHLNNWKLITISSRNLVESFLKE
jgi:hypothetical protein